MAAAIIPIVEAAVPLLTPLIGSLVTHVEHLFGPKTGQTKFDLVLQSVLAAAQQLATAGKIPGQLDPAALATMVQTVVTQLKSAGALTPETAAAAVAKGSVVGTVGATVSGTVLKIVGGQIQIG